MFILVITAHEFQSLGVCVNTKGESNRVGATGFK